MSVQFLITSKKFNLAPSDRTKTTKPVPTDSGDLYLMGLLEKQRGLNVAKDALSLRVGMADADETRYIEIQLGLIDADFLHISAMITSYLESSTVFKAITTDGLAQIRKIVEQLQGVAAAREKAADIVQLVTRLLEEWDGSGNGAAN